MPKYNKETVQQLYKAILSLKTEEECARFFEDVCTIQEMEAIAQRLDVACRLCEGHSYAKVNELTGASTATICRVSKCLNYGEGGYRTAIDRITAQGEN